MPWVKDERVVALDESGRVIASELPQENANPRWWERVRQLMELTGPEAIAGGLLMESVNGEESRVWRREWRDEQAKETGKAWGVEGWAMRPDYGGASLWDEDGLNTEAYPEDLPRLSEAKAKELWERVEAWQAEFERRVDHDGNDSHFEWGVFHSLGMALGRALSDASGRFVMYESPYEDPSRGKSMWINEKDEPEARTERGAELGRALAALDEDRALRAMGAGVPAGALMAPGLTVAHLCAHLGFDRALDKALREHPELATARDKWGCAPLDAAVFGKNARIVRALIEAGASVMEPDKGGRSPVQKACDQTFLKDDDLGLETLEAVASAAPPEMFSKEVIAELTTGYRGRVREGALAILERQALKGVSKERSEAKPRARGPGL